MAPAELCDSDCMKQRNGKTSLSCEQVFNIWSTEPELIQLLDLRPTDKFAQSHIPGARAITLDQLKSEMDRVGRRLAILITSQEQEDTISERLAQFNNFVFLNQCERWSELSYPMIRLRDGIPEISVDDLQKRIQRGAAIQLIDVRKPDEFYNELGHIPGSILVTLGPELTAFLEKGDRSKETVFICRSGARSGTATMESLRLGYQSTANMTGGMIQWNECGFPVERL